MIPFPSTSIHIKNGNLPHLVGEQILWKFCILCEYFFDAREHSNLEFCVVRSEGGKVIAIIYLQNTRETFAKLSFNGAYSMVDKWLLRWMKKSFTFFFFAAAFDVGYKVRLVLFTLPINVVLMGCDTTKVNCIERKVSKKKYHKSER